MCRLNSSSPRCCHTSLVIHAFNYPTALHSAAAVDDDDDDGEDDVDDDGYTDDDDDGYTNDDDDDDDVIFALTASLC